MFDFIIVLGSFIDIIYTEVHVSIQRYTGQYLSGHFSLLESLAFDSENNFNAGVFFCIKSPISSV